jgi:hypothetical protein
MTMASIPQVVQAFGDNFLLIRVSMIDDRIFSWHVEVFELQPDGRYRLLTETVRMRSFDIDQIGAALRSRFADLETIDGAGQPVADDGPGRIWFSCVKPA